MDYTTKVREYFYEAVKLHKACPSELRRALLKKHPNVERYIALLTKEIVAVHAYAYKKQLPPYPESDIKWLVTDMTAIFISNLMTEADRRIESDIAKSTRARIIQDQKDMEATVDGKPQGIFAEMGVITDEKTLGQRNQKA